MLDAIRHALRARRFNCSSEAELQHAIAVVLDGAGISYERERRLTAEDRPDFLVRDVAIEVKVDGTLAALTRQVHRYTQHDAVGAVLVVTNRARLLNVPREMNGKRIEAVSLLEGGL